MILSGKYGPWAAYAFTINYILGVGSLGIPYAMVQAGLLLGPLLLTVVTCISFITVLWVAESVARAEKLATLPCECGHRRWMCLNDHSIGVVPEEAKKPSELDPILDRTPRHGSRRQRDRLWTLGSMDYGTRRKGSFGFFSIGEADHSTASTESATVTSTSTGIRRPKSPSSASESSSSHNYGSEGGMRMLTVVFLCLILYVSMYSHS